MDPADWHGVAMEPLAGGYSGETFVVGEADERVVVRVYRRAPERAAVDASLLRLVRGLVPVPQVLELRHPTTTSPGILVTGYVEGSRLDVALAAGSVNLEALAGSLAETLNALGGIPFLRFGMFAAADLTVAAAQMPADLRDWAELIRPDGRLAGWQDRDWDALLELLDHAEDLVEQEASHGAARTVLVHSDFNPKNILVDPRSSRVVALLDWEFAHAGSPYTDLGNFCRFERDPRLVDPLLAGLAWPPAGGPQRRLRLARAADLWALVELAGRPVRAPVPDLAAELLLAQARTGDLNAWPWDAPRIDPLPAHGL